MLSFIASILPPERLLAQYAPSDTACDSARLGENEKSKCETSGSASGPANPRNPGRSTWHVDLGPVCRSLHGDAGPAFAVRSVRPFSSLRRENASFAGRHHRHAGSARAGEGLSQPPETARSLFHAGGAGLHLRRRILG